MKKLVLIDDNQIMLAHYEDVFKKDRSIEVAGRATDGKQGLELILEKEPDLVLLDMIMPRMDGLSLLKKLSELELGMKKPEVMVVSAVGQESLVEQAFANGAAFYMMKPFEDRILLEQVHRILGEDTSAQTVSDSFTAYHTGPPVLTLEEEVSEVLLTLGVPAHIRGYQYLRDAIMMTVENKDVLNQVTKVLYPAVAKMNNTKPGRVERSIRHAIELSWARGNRDSIRDMFGYSVESSRGKPTNSEYIALIADRIRIRVQHR